MARSCASASLTDLIKELRDIKANTSHIQIDLANKWLSCRLQAVISALDSSDADVNIKDKLKDKLALKCNWDEGSCKFRACAPHVDTMTLLLILQQHLYMKAKKLGQGAHSTVFLARNRETKEDIVIKKLSSRSKEAGMEKAVVREVSILQELKHENVIRIIDIMSNVGGSSVNLVLEYMDCDLRTFLTTQIDSQNTLLDIDLVKNLMLQIIKGVDYVHSQMVMHRDLKPENILIDKRSLQIKISDFGLARTFLPSDQDYTNKVVTLYYRAPEILLASGRADHCSPYSQAVDMWSVGCIMAEMINGDILFKADQELGLLKRITEVMGTPSIEEWPQLHAAGFLTSHVYPKREICERLSGHPQAQDLLSKLLVFDPSRRITAKQALEHSWFHSD